MCQVALLVLFFDSLWNPVTSSPGICTTTDRIHNTRWGSYTVSYQKTYWEFCAWYSVSRNCIASSVAYTQKWSEVTYYTTKIKRQCCSRYKSIAGGDGLVCAPICSPDCKYGYCKAPDYCICYHGYITKDNNTCEPICTQDCINGICVKPETCECLEGFKMESSNRCIPHCSMPCINGECVAPEKCSCLGGYAHEGTENNCLPVCTKPCLNGICIAPDKCECNEGYQLRGTTNICEPICKQDCINGICVKPETCECVEGFKMESSNRCIPHCSTPCINGICIAPEKCSCLDGYTQLEENDNECIPACTEQCLNGLCIAPDTCECNEGYQLNDTQYLCVPICSYGCLYSECVQPDLCECFDGYEKLSDYECTPICNETCVNGVCVAPDLCECFVGYDRDFYNESICIPVCEPSCINGECVRPDECVCFHGYEPDGPYYCKPICSTKCQNGNCTEPNKCTCWEGYAFSNDDNMCVPICSVPCDTGKCIAPDLSSSFHSCNTTEDNPVCRTGCLNGECALPNICNCKDGYITNPLNNTECIPATNGFDSYQYFLQNITIKDAVLVNDFEDYYFVQINNTVDIKKTCSSITKLANELCPEQRTDSGISGFFLNCLPNQANLYNVIFLCSCYDSRVNKTDDSASWNDTDYEQNSTAFACNYRNHELSEEINYNITDLHLILKLPEVGQSDIDSCSVQLCIVGSRKMQYLRGELLLYLETIGDVPNLVQERIGLNVKYFMPFGATMLTFSIILITWYGCMKRKLNRPGNTDTTKSIEEKEIEIIPNPSSEEISLGSINLKE